MAEYMDVKFKNELGEVHINKSVFEWIARNIVEEMKGVDIVDGSFKKGVVCTLSKEGLLKIEIEVKLDYGMNAERTSRTIQENVINNIKNSTDVVADQVDISVIGFHFK
ncbi:MAG: Asp23/Gls24 family envelope stress response protein [Erysipelothrix sp.]|nr:Asp23/Gls24 family envelope stress response protein [Erysipelothrix sp.]